MLGASMVIGGAPFTFIYCLKVAQEVPGWLSKTALAISVLPMAFVSLIVLNVLPVLVGLVSG